MKCDVFDLPESLYEFAQIADFYGVIEDLANLVEDEDWNYHNTLGTTTDFPILENYIRNTYIRLAREKKVAYSSDFGFCCFDTGLLSKVQHEPIYMQFCENTNPNIDCYWYFSKFFRRGDNEVRRYPKLPEMAFYWEDPTKLIFDPRKELIVNVEHIIQDNKARFPNPFSTMPDYQLQLFIDGSVKAAP